LADAAASNPFEQPIARLGCGVHQELPSFRTLTHSALNRSIAESLGYSNPRVTQSQLIAKLAGIGGSIVPHQDGCVSFTNPLSCLTFWYALEDATVENGCLRVAKGSHQTEPLRQRLTKSEGGKPNSEDLETPLWAKGAHRTANEVGQTEYHYQPLEVKKGTLVLFHGNLMHTSGMNKSEKSKIAYAFSVIDGDAECLEDSYMKPLEGNFERL
jgi:phytanoyl-CoA hydroxylase